MTEHHSKVLPNIFIYHVWTHLCYSPLNQVVTYHLSWHSYFTISQPIHVFAQEVDSAQVHYCVTKKLTALCSLLCY